MSNTISTALLYLFIKKLSTPFTKWPAFRQKIIDRDGNILIKSKDRKTAAQKRAFSKLDLVILKLKRLLSRLPGGKGKIATASAALWFLKENIDEHEEEYFENLDDNDLEYTITEIMEEIANATGSAVAGSGDTGIHWRDNRKNKNKKVIRRKKLNIRSI